MTLTVTPTDANKALVRRAIGYNHGTAEDATEIFAPDFVAYMPGKPPMDRATFEHYVAGTTVVFPGYTYEIHDQCHCGRGANRGGGQLSRWANRARGGGAAAGRSNRQTADELVLSVLPVERHITNIYAKVGARGKADATAYAFRHGLIY